MPGHLKHLWVFRVPLVGYIEIAAMEGGGCLLQGPCFSAILVLLEFLNKLSIFDFQASFVGRPKKQNKTCFQEEVPVLHSYKRSCHPAGGNLSSRGGWPDLSQDIPPRRSVHPLLVLLKSAKVRLECIYTHVSAAACLYSKTRSRNCS